MSENVYDLARNLEKSIREIKEFKGLQDAYKDVRENAEAKEKFDRFRKIQVTIQESQMKGQEIDEETMKSAQKIAEDIQQNEKIIKLMEKEQAMSTIINDLNRIIMEPLQELYKTNE